MVCRYCTSNGDLRRKQSNHKTDESMKTDQSVGLFAWLFLLVTLLYLNVFYMVCRYCTSNGDLRRKQSNHKTDESMKIGHSLGFFGQLFLFRDTPLSQNNYRV